MYYRKDVAQSEYFKLLKVFWKSVFLLLHWWPNQGLRTLSGQLFTYS